MNIKQITDTAECCSCGACYSICPQSAISIEVTNIGRKYAKINDNCIECGLCSKVCPVFNATAREQFSDLFVGDILNCYIGKSLDRIIFDNAQSGGLCTTVLKYLFDNKMIDAAVVTCMEEGHVPLVHSKIVTTVNELYESQKSCYTMVDVLSSLKDSSSYKSIAVVGLPCQIHAVNELCKTSTKFKNIKYKLGLVCDRTLCSTIQEVMLKLAGIKEEKVKIQWRRKKGSYNSMEFSYRSAPITITSNDKIIAALTRENRLGLKEYFTPPCCYKCTDKLGIYADVVFGDPWGVSGADFKNGESLFITRTKNGEEIISGCLKQNCITLRNADRNEVLTGQKINQKRKSTLSNSVQVKISDFLLRERLSKDQIVDLAIDVLKKEKRKKESFLYKAQMFCKRIIKKIS